MKPFFIILLLFSAVLTQAQQEGDSKISMKVADTSDMYSKVKLALIKNGYIIKDDMNKTLLTTYTAVKKHVGYTAIKAQIDANTVTIWGFYSNKKWRNIYGFEIESGKFYKIIYFKGGNGWDVLLDIVQTLGGHDLSFSK